jgi:hypothetical protein
VAEDSIQEAPRLSGETWLVPGNVDAFDNKLRPRTRKVVYAIQEAMGAVGAVINESMVGGKLNATSLAIGFE